MSTTQRFRIDSFVESLAMKAPCVVATNAAITLIGEQTVNSVAVVELDRVLVKDQANPVENGIYDVSTSAWQRSQDWDGERDATNGTIVIVASEPLDNLYMLSSAVPLSIDVGSATFTLMATADLGGILASNATGEGASTVGIEDAADNFTATDVEAALAEIYAAFAATTPGLGDTKNKLAHETVISSTLLQNDDELAGWNLETHKHYYLEATIFGAQNVNGFRYRFKLSNTSSESGVMQFQINDATGDTTNMTIGNATIETVELFPGGGAGGLNDGQTWTLQVRLWFRANVINGGTLDFQWAQETSGVNGTTVSKGSRVTLYQLD